MIWLLMAMALLYLMKESIQVYNPADPSVEYSIWGLMMLPYIVTLKPEPNRGSRLSAFPSHEEEMETITTSYSEATLPDNASSDPIIRRQGPSPSEPVMRRSAASVPEGSNCVTIRVNHALKFWIPQLTLIRGAGRNGGCGDISLCNVCVDKPAVPEC